MTETSTPNTKCQIPPAGWVCTRAAGHDGPCAAVKKPGFWRRVGGALVEVLGNVMYQGPR